MSSDESTCYLSLQASDEENCPSPPPLPLDQPPVDPPLPSPVRTFHCNWCNTAGHITFKCALLTSIPPSERAFAVTQRHKCRNCLGTHATSRCKSPKRCAICGLKHHTLLHAPPTPAFSSPQRPQPLMANLQVQKPQPLMATPPPTPFFSNRPSPVPVPLMANIHPSLQHLVKNPPPKPLKSILKRPRSSAENAFSQTTPIPPQFAPPISWWNESSSDSDPDFPRFHMVDYRKTPKPTPSSTPSASSTAPPPSPSSVSNEVSSPPPFSSLAQFPPLPSRAAASLRARKTKIPSPYPTSRPIPLPPPSSTIPVVESPIFEVIIPREYVPTQRPTSQRPSERIRLRQGGYFQIFRQTTPRGRDVPSRRFSLVQSLMDPAPQPPPPSSPKPDL